MTAARVEPTTTAWGAEAIRLTADGSSALVQLHGGQVVDWTPGGGAPVLWMPPAPAAITGKATRGGVPVCWPWFGPAATPGQPAHGTVRTAVWSVIESGTDRGVARVVLEPPVSALPVGVGLQLVVDVGAGLRLALTTENRSPAPFAYSEALHTYFAIGDIAEVRVEGFDGAAFLDQLQPGSRLTQAGAIRFGAEVDRVYHASPAPITIVDEAAGRTIRLSGSGSASTVVWNPWAEKAARLGDLGPEGWRRMLCVETANAPGIAQLAPGAAATLAVEITMGGS